MAQVPFPFRAGQPVAPPPPVPAPGSVVTITATYSQLPVARAAAFAPLLGNAKKAFMYTKDDSYASDFKDLYPVINGGYRAYDQRTYAPLTYSDNAGGTRVVGIGLAHVGGQSPKDGNTYTSWAQDAQLLALGNWCLINHSFDHSATGGALKQLTDNAAITAANLNGYVMRVITPPSGLPGFVAGGEALGGYLLYASEGFSNPTLGEADGLGAGYVDNYPYYYKAAVPVPAPNAARIITTRQNLDSQWAPGVPAIQSWVDQCFAFQASENKPVAFSCFSHNANPAEIQYVPNFFAYVMNHDSYSDGDVWFPHPRAFAEYEEVKRLAVLSAPVVSGNTLTWTVNLAALPTINECRDFSLLVPPGATGVVLTQSNAQAVTSTVDPTAGLVNVYLKQGTAALNVALPLAPPPAVARLSGTIPMFGKLALTDSLARISDLDAVWHALPNVERAYPMFDYHLLPDDAANNSSTLPARIEWEAVPGQVPFATEVEIYDGAGSTTDGITISYIDKNSGAKVPLTVFRGSDYNRILPVPFPNGGAFFSRFVLDFPNETVARPLGLRMLGAYNNVPYPAYVHDFVAQPVDALSGNAWNCYPYSIYPVGTIFGPAPAGETPTQFAARVEAAWAASLDDMQGAVKFVRIYTDYADLQRRDPGRYNDVAAGNIRFSAKWPTDEIYARLRAIGVQVMVVLINAPTGVYETWPLFEGQPHVDSVLFKRPLNGALAASYDEAFFFPQQYKIRYGSLAFPASASKQATVPNNSYETANDPQLAPLTAQGGMARLQVGNENGKAFKGLNGWMRPAYMAAWWLRNLAAHNDPAITLVMPAIVGFNYVEVNTICAGLGQLAGLRPDGTLDVVRERVEVDFHIYTQVTENNVPRGCAPEVTSAPFDLRECLRAVQRWAPGWRVVVTEFGYGKHPYSVQKVVATPRRSIPQRLADLNGRTVAMCQREGAASAVAYQIDDDGLYVNDPNTQLTNSDISDGFRHAPYHYHLYQSYALLNGYDFDAKLSNPNYVLGVPCVDRLRHRTSGKYLYRLWMIDDLTDETGTYALSLPNGGELNRLQDTGRTALKTTLPAGTQTIALTGTICYVKAL